ncbi:hypothetical protein SAMD00019534_017120 [Acytostelium subglobosum LB1]|uniref:hypothetical protein n=1 Tax=Acytostelium subglobosum LB1 TaxID=1410327 RepID=UPI0006448FC7|nr:hypothetical protein SAMD00019534_017120 [Acytostelium subglobosum LB1]GAM18537.1 hypothetical protein SAMD00019534_017120 [Acytostelium subglobosum LB1]|eukprot:XP_012757757.1 hypothetical protein SAMD00019534_017120 [Acytostelium subglobosum LB1]
MFSPFKCVNHTALNTSEPRIGQLLRKSNDDHLLRGASNILKPVVLVPGVGGSSLEAKLNKNLSPHWYCVKKNNWFRIWLGLSELAVQDCWFDNMNVHYDNNTGDFSNAPGVLMRPMDFGGLNGIDYLDKAFGFPISLTNVYGDMIMFFKDLGYTSTNLIGAPYDWRMPISQLEKDGWFNQFRLLIEDTYHNNNEQKVVLLCHSMGGLLSLHFLNSMTDEWRLKYLDSFVPIAAPWSGSPNALRTIISGDDFGITFMSWNKLRDFSRESGGVAQLLPTNINYEDNHVFVSNKGKDYQIAHTSDLFDSIGLFII